MRTLSLLCALLTPAVALAHELPADVPPPPGCNPIGIEKHDWDFADVELPPEPPSHAWRHERIFGPRLTNQYWQCAGRPPYAAWAEPLRAQGWTIDRADDSYMRAHKGDTRFLVSVGHLIVIDRGEPRAFAVPPPGPEPIELREDADVPWLPAMPDLIATRRIVAKAPVELWHPTGTYARPPFADQSYVLKGGLAEVEVIEVYRRALAAAGWEILSKAHPGGGEVVAHYTADGRDLWAKLVSAGTSLRLIAADAGASEAAARLRERLEAEGHVALYGIYFDTGSPVLKPESRSALEHARALLADAPGLKVEVQGHTDNTGKNPGNQLLSDARAAAVRDWLVEHGIDRARLDAKGYADQKPVADNRTAEGRAQNRRVELVKR